MTGSEERSRAKGARLGVGGPGVLSGWLNGIEINSAAVLNAYLLLKRGGDAETLSVE